MKLLLLQTTVFLGLYYPLVTNATLAEIPRRLTVEDEQETFLVANATLAEIPRRVTVEDEETLHGSLRTRNLKKAAAPAPASAPAPTPKKGKTPGDKTTSDSSSTRAVYNPGPCIPYANIPESIFNATRAKSANISAKDAKNGITPATYNVCLEENGCSTGGCRYYNWLQCDTEGGYPWLKFVCNNGAAAPLPAIPVGTATSAPKSDTTTGGGVISGLNAGKCANVDTTAQQAKWKSSGFNYASCQRSSDCENPDDCCAENFCACLPVKNIGGRCV